MIKSKELARLEITIETCEMGSPKPESVYRAIAKNTLTNASKTSIWYANYLDAVIEGTYYISDMLRWTTVSPFRLLGRETRENKYEKIWRELKQTHGHLPLGIGSQSDLRTLEQVMSEREEKEPT